ncbi:S8 family serine peptidase [Streptomyces sp. NPDC006691]|uniref:S8 family serine peptidase n=1 Tax=Streptomyces sp. NPDC006691 TaxID=3364757 RepID=UPI0036BC2686
MTGTPARRRAASACVALGFLSVASAGLAPHAFADAVAPKQWYLDSMQASEMWKTSTGSGVVVAVVDSGVNAETSSLKGQVLDQGVPAAARYGATKDYDGHGTTMAELIAGTGQGGGIKGLAPGAKIIPLRVVLSTLKDPAERERTQQPAAAIRAAADSNAKIINMSFASEVKDQATQDAVEYAVSKGKLLIAGAGNDEEKHDAMVTFPAALRGVVGVAAADKSGTVAKYSQSGGFVDLASPGLDVPGWCDATFQQYCNSGGTSAGTAIASASAALIWSAHPSWTADQVLRTMIDTAGRSWDRNTPSKYLGYGLIRPRLVLEKPDIDPGPADVDPVSQDQGGSSAAPATPAAPSSPAPPKSGPVATGKEACAGGGDNTPWVIGGVVAGLIAIGGGVFAAIRSRRRGA